MTMKLLVAVKRVVDPYVKIRIKPDHSGIDVLNAKMSMNPFDEIALEEALRLREQGVASEVVVVSLGRDPSLETLRQGLALGADRAILVRLPDGTGDDCSLNKAHVLKAVIDRETPDLVLMGKQSIDGDAHQIPQMVAALLDWPQATCASALSMVGERTLSVTRETDGGVETLELMAPAVVSVDLRLNKPRYASLPNIMKAKQKPLEVIELDALGVVLRQRVQVLAVTPPATRKMGVIVDSVEALVDKLKHEANVL